MRSFAKYAAVFAAAMGAASVASAASVTFLNADGSAATNYVGAANYTALGTQNGVGIDSFATGELSVRQIAAGWAGLLNLNLVFTRIYDFGVTDPEQPNISGNPSPLTDYTDAVWSDGTVDIAFKAKYAGQFQRLGTLTGNSGSTYFDAVDVQQSGNTVEAFSASISTGGTPFLFGRSNTGSATAAQISNHADDRMISFLVTAVDANGNPAPGLDEPTYAIFFEDGTDDDFNDLGVLFSGRAPGVEIPLPGAAVMGLALMGGAGLTRARRRMA